VYAALLLEYVDVQATLGRMPDFLNPGGTLVTVVQLPAVDLPRSRRRRTPRSKPLEAV